jgi:hypothetical protein
MIDDTCAIIVQAAAFAAAEILHKEESSVSSRAGRITAGRIQRQYTMLIAVLANPVFNVNIACPTNHSGIRPTGTAPLCGTGGGDMGVKLSCHFHPNPSEMGELQQVFVLHVPINTLPGGPHMISWGHMESHTHILWPRV